MKIKEAELKVKEKDQKIKEAELKAKKAERELHDSILKATIATCLSLNATKGYIIKYLMKNLHLTKKEAIRAYAKYSTI